MSDSEPLTGDLYLCRIPGSSFDVRHADRVGNAEHLPFCRQVRVVRWGRTVTGGERRVESVCRRSGRNHAGRRERVALVREPSRGLRCRNAAPINISAAPSHFHAIAAWSTQTGNIRRFVLRAVCISFARVPFGTACISYAHARAVPVHPWIAPADADRDRSASGLDIRFLRARRLVRPRSLLMWRNPLKASTKRHLRR